MPEPATNGTMLLISLGPIQDFIQSARRCQDLWFGSWLLSDLARTVGEAVSESTGEGGAVVFPAGAAKGATDVGRAGVSNLIFALLPPSALAEDVVGNAKAKMQARLDQLAEQAWSPGDEPQVRAMWERHFHRAVAEQQLAELMEWLWVSMPRSGPGDSTYAADRDMLYRRMASLKNTRGWSQPPWRPETGVPKSALDGERESVIDEAIFVKNNRPDMRPSAVQLRRRAFGAKRAERLCGIGLLKRRGHELDQRQFRGGKPPFHSTSHVAAGPAIQALQGRPELVRRYLGSLEELGLYLGRFKVQPSGNTNQLRLGGGFDGGLLFESRMDDHFEEDSAIEDPAALKQAISQAKAALRGLRRDAKLAEPSPYYAFLIADGDHMGRAIDLLTDPAGHRGLAGALNRFADGCRQIVEDSGGSLIFSGGDDVMALLPLHTALACARALANDFAQKLGAYGSPGERPTLSVGLGISHAREPMSEARRLAGQAEKRAKESGKNALCVIVAKRSGGDTAVVGRWDQGPEGQGAPDRRFAAWITLLRAGALSAKTAHDLEEVADHYATLSPVDQRARAAEITALCQQVLNRKRRSGGEERSGKDAVLDALLAPVMALSSDPNQPGPVAVVRQLSHELQIARVFAQAQAHAEGAELALDDSGAAETSNEHEAW